jgi:ATP-dependent RNA helicase DDX20
MHTQVHGAKQDALVRLLHAVRFHQAVVFCNQRWHAQQLVNTLTAAGFPARFTCGALAQPQRAAAMDAMRSFRLRVLVSTDLTARGVDLQHVNLVVQYTPWP